MGTSRKQLSRPWTSEDDDLLRSVLGSGKGAAVAAAKLKRSTGAVFSRAKVLRLSVAIVRPKVEVNER